MNLFEKYGIKEVADVVFYSINQVGDDEIIYTPVLFLDTLKVSTIEKSASTAFAQGGLGNKKLIQWSYGKELKLTLEDALFSPASMSMLIGDKLDAELSTLSSVVSKIYMANLYGRLRYSTKAYPSPTFSSEEWEVIFKVLQNAGVDGTATLLDLFDPDVESTLSDEWKQAFMDRYYSRPNYFDGINSVNIDEEKWTYLYDKNTFGVSFGEDYLKGNQLGENGFETINNNYDKNGNLKPTKYAYYEAKAMPEYVIFILRNIINDFDDIGNVETAHRVPEVIDRWEKCLVTDKNGLEISQKKQLDNLFKYYSNDQSETYTIYYDPKNMLPIMSPSNEKKWWNYESYDTNELKNFYFKWDKSSGTTEYHNINIDFLDSDHIKDYPYLQKFISDRFKECTVDTSITLDGIPQVVSLEMIKLLFNTWDFCEYLMPRNVPYKIESMDLEFNVDSGSIRCVSFKAYSYDKFFSNAETTKDVINFLDFFYMADDALQSLYEELNKLENDIIHLKEGTTYYKWTRTVKYREYEDDSILGNTIIIDSDTFPNDYRIVGETYIRNQKTGKDERFQFTIFRAAISSTTSLTLQADGDPTTFSMDVDVLSPENDVLMELIQIDVEEDRFEGGTRIVPMKQKASYTRGMEESGEVLVPIDNNEIY